MHRYGSVNESREADVGSLERGIDEKSMRDKDFALHVGKGVELD